MKRFRLNDLYWIFLGVSLWSCHSEARKNSKEWTPYSQNVSHCIDGIQTQFAVPTHWKCDHVYEGGIYDDSTTFCGFGRNKVHTLFTDNIVISYYDSLAQYEGEISKKFCIGMRFIKNQERLAREKQPTWFPWILKKQMEHRDSTFRLVRIQQNYLNNSPFAIIDFCTEYAPYNRFRFLVLDGFAAQNLHYNAVYEYQYTSTGDEKDVLQDSIGLKILHSLQMNADSTCKKYRIED